MLILTRKLSARSPYRILSVWLKASRLQSQSYIFIPILLGQACAYVLTEDLDWTIFLLLHLFGMFNQLYIVYANDYADHITDGLNTTHNLFSGGSRVLVEGLLKPHQLRMAAILMALMCLLIGIILWVGYERTYAMPLIFFGLALLWAYSYDPLRLSYRGGGELLQMIGVGLVLPLFAFYAQTGTWEGVPIGLILSLLPIQLACAISTSLPDAPSDARSGKRTVAVILGLKGAKITLIALSLLSVGLLSILHGMDFTLVTILGILALPVLLIFLHLRHLDAQPDSKGLFLFNMYTVMAVLLLQVGIIIALFI